MLYCQCGTAPGKKHPNHCPFEYFGQNTEYIKFWLFCQQELIQKINTNRKEVNIETNSKTMHNLQKIDTK